jgi:hypothetical protein
VVKFWRLGNEGREIGFFFHDMVLSQQTWAWFIGNHLKEILASLFCMIARQTKHRFVIYFFDALWWIDWLDIIYFIGWYSDAGVFFYCVGHGVEYGDIKLAFVSIVIIVMVIYEDV